MYSSGPMGGEAETTGRLEERVAELEGLVAALDGATDAEAVGLLERSAALLAEVTRLLEGVLDRAEGEARDLAGLLEGLDFGPFDRALAEVEGPAGRPTTGGGAGGGRAT